MDVQCLHTLTQAEPFRADMDALNLASPRPDPFSSFAYYQHHLAIARQFTPPADAATLWLLLAFRDRTLVGYLALKRRRQRVLGMPATTLDLLTAHVADRPHLVARAADQCSVAEACYRYLLGRRRDWSLLEFQQQGPDSPLLNPPAEASGGGLHRRDWPNMANGTIPLAWATTAAYFAALSKKARSNVGRQMRALLAAGEVEVLASSDAKTRAVLFELYQGIEAHSWKTGVGGAIGSDPQRLAHYRGLMAPGQPMQLHIQILLLDGVPIAGLISGAFERGLYALHIVYDERVARLAPGSAIFWMGMRRAIEGGYRYFDLLWGFGYYKTRWLAEMSETRSLRLYQSGSPLLWKRLLGDFRRRYLGGQGEDDSSRGNPLRPRAEAAETAGPEPPPEQPLPDLADTAQRQRYAELRRRILGGDGEFLGAVELAAAMPFPTGRDRAAATGPMFGSGRKAESGTDSIRRIPPWSIDRAAAIPDHRVAGPAAGS